MKENNAPLVSFVLLAYNQEKYIADAVLSALAQTYSPLEILISDDCSSDATYQIIKTTVGEYRGPHKVIVNRNGKNIGLASSINKAWSMTEGDLIVVQAGDDISIPERSTILTKLWTTTVPKPGLVFSNVSYMNSDGEITKIQTDSRDIPTLEDVIKGQWFIAGGMACAYSRSVLEEYGPLDSRVIYEDFVLTFRALVAGGCAHTNKSLVMYRIHDESIMGMRRMELPKDRLAVEKWANHIIPEYEDRLKVFSGNGWSSFIFALKMKRLVSYYKLERVSSSSSRSKSFICFFGALLTARPRTALSILMRDVFHK